MEGGVSFTGCGPLGAVSSTSSFFRMGRAASRGSVCAWFLSEKCGAWCP